jgi:ferredoxin-NADP reductase
MMAMLRYMDGLCLETSATLRYCVRTRGDIMFESELERLRFTLKNFRYHVLLSQPHLEWSGHRGRISREFIVGTVTDVIARDFFLCGPPAFMDAGRGIPANLGVIPERIMQESFGGSGPKIPQTFRRSWLGNGTKPRAQASVVSNESYCGGFLLQREHHAQRCTQPAHRGHQRYVANAETSRNWRHVYLVQPGRRASGEHWPYRDVVDQ